MRADKFFSGALAVRVATVPSRGDVVVARSRIAVDADLLEFTARDGADVFCVDVVVF